MADQRYQPDVVPPTDASADALLEVIQTVALELHPHRQSIVSASLDSSLERELGFDSLGRVELLQRVERAFGVQLPDQLLATAETPRDLLRALTTAGARSRMVDAETGENATPLGGRRPPDPGWHARRGAGLACPGASQPPASLLLRRPRCG